MSNDETLDHTRVDKFRYLADMVQIMLSQRIPLSHIHIDTLVHS